MLTCAAQKSIIHISIHFCITGGYCINGRVYTKIFFISEDLKRKISMNLTKVLSAKHPAVHMFESNIGRGIPSVAARTAAVRRASSVTNMKGKRRGVIVKGYDNTSGSGIISNTGVRIDNSNIVAESMISERIRIMGDISYE